MNSYNFKDFSRFLTPLKKCKTTLGSSKVTIALEDSLSTSGIIAINIW